MKTYNLEELNEFIENRVLRRYQFLIANGENFYFNYENDTFLFMSSHCKQGINELEFKKDNNKYLTITSFQLAKAYELKVDSITLSSTPNRPKSDNKKRTIIRTGHSNFAHFIWNQLPAVLLLKRIVCNSKFLIQGEVDTIIPIECINGHNYQGDKLSDQNDVYVGSTFISKETSLFIQSILDKNPYQTIEKNRNKDIKIIYLGIRGPGNRELLNEKEFYLKVIKKINDALNKKVYFYIDGFSYQLNNYNDEKAISRCKKIEDIIKNIILESGSDNIESINGMSIVDFYRITNTFDFYITHEGTMQHKIGWLSKKNIPGFLLTGSKNTKSIVNWHKGQVNNGKIQKIHTFEKKDVEQESIETIKRNNRFSILNLNHNSDKVTNIIKNKLCQT